MIFGGVDKTQYTGDLFSYVLESKYFWAPKVELIAYDNEIIEMWDLGKS